jgi:diacylglycerol kinase (ATP)
VRGVDSAVSALFIINPRAGRGSGRKIWERISRRVSGSRLFDAVIPGSSAETRQAAADAVKAGIGRVIVVGGDGTLAAVAGELAFSATTLGVIPAGTGNDFCRNTGIPRQPDAALEIAIGPQTQVIDMGQAAGGRYFLNAAGIGFDAEVAAAASAFPAGLGGTLPYLLGAFATIARYKPMPVVVTVDEQRYCGPAMLVVAANGRCYGGGMQVAPLADPGDGQLDVCIATDVGRVGLLNLIRQAYAGGHIRHPRVVMLRGASVSVAVEGAVRAHLDGEPLPPQSLTFEARRGALSVATPLQSHVAADRDWADLGYGRFGSSGSAFWSE